MNLNLELIMSQLTEFQENYHELTEAEETILRGSFGDNLTTQGIYVDDEFNYIIIEGEYSNNNWRYYAGFEYIEEKPITIIIANFHLSIYVIGLHERVSDILEKFEVLGD
jgi:hypothetical protein